MYVYVYLAHSCYSPRPARTSPESEVIVMLLARAHSEIFCQQKAATATAATIAATAATTTAATTLCTAKANKVYLKVLRLSWLLAATFKACEFAALRLASPSLNSPAIQSFSLRLGLCFGYFVEYLSCSLVKQRKLINIDEAREG